ncbi:MAG: site-2 protease family protein [Anaeromyxobacter sp.]|nr:site-2 protease family protein [Anaeromyxobacter sp.]MBL0277941.1 site-2 protease family protein [Anaeromyxobacter sp.]
MFSADALLSRLLFLPLWIISLSIHEYCHAWSAFKLGDDTASREGRLTLNPLAHIDVLGTIVAPLLFSFGWAKPVPINPTRFRRDVSMGAGMAISAGAGPLSNLVLATLSAVAYGVGLRLAPGLVDRGSVGELFLLNMLTFNVMLALFNMIPIPPLDGSRIVAWLLPYRLRDQWHALESFAPFLLMGVFFFGGRLISGPVQHLSELLFQLALRLA